MEEETGTGTPVDLTTGGQPKFDPSALLPSADTIWSGAIGIGRDILQQSFYKKNREREQEFAKDMFDYEHQANIEDWNRQNQYNLPANQYARYIAAGMSPAAAMEAVAGVDGSAAAPNPTHQSPNSAGTAGSTGWPNAHTMLDQEALRSQIMLNKTLASKNEAETQRTLKMTDLEVDNLRKDILEKNSKIELNDALKAKYYEETDQIRQMTPLKIEETQESIKKIQIEISEKKQAIENLKQQVNESKAREKLFNAETEATWTQNEGQIWKNYQDQVAAFKADITRKLVDTLGINPDDSVWHQLIEGSLDGTQLTNYLDLLQQFCAGTRQYIKEETPFDIKALFFMSLLEMLEKGHDQKVGRKLDNATDLMSLIFTLAKMAPQSGVNPIGFK